MYSELQRSEISSTSYRCPVDTARATRGSGLKTIQSSILLGRDIGSRYTLFNTDTRNRATTQYRPNNALDQRKVARNVVLEFGVDVVVGSPQRMLLLSRSTRWSYPDSDLG